MSRRFAYAQVRLQVRYGQRPRESDWRQLTALIEPAAFLEQARAGGLRPWVAGVGATTPVHELERLLRARLRARIEEVARWVPEEWRPAVRWTRFLVDLPALDHLLHGEPPHDWMREEEDLKPLADVEPELRRRALAQTACGALARGPREEGAGLFEAWLVEWRRLLPHVAGRAAHRLEALVVLVQAHRQAFARLDASGAAAWEARRRLEEALARRFRTAFLEPAAAFAYLLLVAIDAERLRAELLTRTIFAAGVH